MPVLERNKLSSEISAIAEKYGSTRSALLPVLVSLQAKYGNITDVMMQETADQLGIRPVEVYGVASFYHFLRVKPAGKYVFSLCKTLSCDFAGKARVARQLENELEIKFGETDKDGLFSLEYVNCLGMCDQGPALLVNDKIFTKVTPAKVIEIVNECKCGRLDKRDVYANVESTVMKKGPALSSDAESHEGLKKALSMSRVDLINEVRQSGLKGRGGAGFPTAVKWQIAAASKGERKYVVCNADEGEPGTFKDRLLLMEYPELLFDGMTIAGYAIGAENGILYLRGEYVFMKETLEAILEKRRETGLAGKNVFGKENFNFDIEIRMGAGAYICGEETALIESLEGKRGEPRNRPPFPVVVGLDGFPTAVNNVETLVIASLIVENGPEWFSSIGTDKTRGNKLLSVSGDCETPGIYEIPMGISINELLKLVKGEGAKAVQIGGASGSCVPAKEFDRKIAYEDVATGGSVMVIGADRDMLEVAENFVDFFVDESCGQCFLCRKGNVKMLEGIKKLKEGKLSTKSINDLKSLGQSMQKASKCGLGQTSANAFLSILDNFADELLGRVQDSK